MSRTQLIPFSSPSVKSSFSATITSRELADQMGMLHKNLLQIITKVVKEYEGVLIGCNVQPIGFKDSRNRTKTEYRITEVGLLLLAPKLSLHCSILELFVGRLQNLAEQNFQLIKTKNLRLEEKLKKRDNPESGETIPNYTTDESGKTTKEILFMRNISRIERLDAMLSNCRVQEIGRAKQVAKLDWMKRDTEKGVIEPCKYYGLKSVYSPYLDEDCRD